MMRMLLNPKSPLNGYCVVLDVTKRFQKMSNDYLDKCRTCYIAFSDLFLVCTGCIA